MTLSRKIVFFFFSLLLLFACNQSISSNEALKMYEASELSILMRNMHDTLESWKPKVASGDSMYVYPKYFERVHSAKATNPEEIDEAFYLLASNFENTIWSFKSNPNRETYNIAVSACITCHKNYCQGPIPKIKKLKIEI